MKRAVTLFLAMILAMPAFAAGLSSPVDPVTRLASSQCHAVGQQKARQLGGQLAKASPRKVNGQTVCVIVVLVPGKNGQRPRRAEFVIPQ